MHVHGVFEKSDQCIEKEIKDVILRDKYLQQIKDYEKFDSVARWRAILQFYSDVKGLKEAL